MCLVSFLAAAQQHLTLLRTVGNFITDEGELLVDALDPFASPLDPGSLINLID